MGGKSKADRDSAKDILPYGCIFSVYIQRLTDEDGEPIEFSEDNWVFLTKVFIRDKASQPKQYSFTIKNLPYARYYFKLEPHTTNPGNSNANRLGVSGKITQVNGANTIRGQTPIILGEWEGQPTNDTIEDTIKELYDKRSASSDSGAPIRITSISEHIDPDALEADLSYQKIAMAGVKIKASDRINSAPDLSLFVKEGREILNSLASGTHQGVRSSTTVVYYDDNFNDIPELVIGVSKIKNLDTGFVGTVSGFSVNSITSSITFAPGHRFLVYTIKASCYFPDIYVDLLVNPDGGLGSMVDADNDIDWDSIVTARRFCAESQFYWDSVIQQQINFANWATENAALSRLIPMKIGGRYGLMVEKPDLPIRAIFNESNIIKDSFQEEFIPWQDNITNQIVLTYVDGTDIQRPITAVVCQTNALVANQEVLSSINIEGLSITNFDQAKNIAGTILKAKRLQNKTINFKTATQGLYLTPGDLIIVQHQITEYDYEVSGYITYCDDYDSVDLTQRFLLSREFTSDNLADNYRITAQLQTNGEVIENLPFSLEIEGSYRYLRITPGSLNATLTVGDPVIIGKVSVTNKTYRIQSLSTDIEGVISVNAVIWDEQMFNHSDLTFYSS